MEGRGGEGGGGKWRGGRGRGGEGGEGEGRLITQRSGINNRSIYIAT